MIKSINEQLKRKRHILIVDDEEINRDILSMILEDDYDLSFAINGKEALDYIAKNENNLSLILLDILMPVMNGIDVLKELNKRQNKIPVIVLTSEKTMEVECLNLGANDFIKKPYEAHEIIQARVLRNIELYEDRNIITLTSKDKLTDLYTKNYFITIADEMDKYNKNDDMDLLMVDIQSPHLIQEMFGPTFIDLLIVNTAAFVGNYLKDKNGIACRDENHLFNIYVEHQDNYNDLANGLIATIKKIKEDSNIYIRIGIYPHVDKDISKEIALDRIKEACDVVGVDYSTTFAYYDESLHQKELFRRKLINEFPKALEEGQFKVYIQPKYNIVNEKPFLEGGEALVRWIHPQLGMISPGEFIPLFEGNGLITKLDYFVFKEIANYLSRLKKEYNIDNLPISVNVSRMDVFDPNFENMMLDLIKTNKINPSNLHLEVTESAYSNNKDQITEVIRNLQKNNFVIEMDDFGSGYSSLNMLTDLPFNILKLDMGFIRNMDKNGANKKIIMTIHDLAKFIGVKIISEGVETEEQYKFLKGIGCDMIQGYYFSKPLPMDDFHKLLLKERNL